MAPLHVGMTDDHFDRILSQLNGALFIGGFNGPDGRVWPEVRRVWEHALMSAKAGEVFPLWGTCQGLDDMVQLASGTTYSRFMISTLADDFPAPLDFKPLSTHDFGPLFDEAQFPGAHRFRKWLHEMPITYHHHDSGISPSILASLPNIPNILEVVATSRDRRGFEFISIIQGKTLPIFASAFHPEKPAFEWPLVQASDIVSLQIPHSQEAVMANEHLGSVFVSYARRSNRTFQNMEDLRASLIYDSKLVYTRNRSGLIRYFDECFFV